MPAAGRSGTPALLRSGSAKPMRRSASPIARNTPPSPTPDIVIGRGKRMRIRPRGKAGRRSTERHFDHSEEAEMGWLFHDDKLRHQTPAEYFAQHFTHESENHSAAVIAIATATVRGTVYVAIRNLNKETGATYVFCAVIRFKN